MLPLILFGALGVLGVAGILVAVQEHGGLAGIRAILERARSQTCDCGHAEIQHSPVFGLCMGWTGPGLHEAIAGLPLSCGCTEFHPAERG